LTNLLQPERMIYARSGIGWSTN